MRCSALALVCALTLSCGAGCSPGECREGSVAIALVTLADPTADRELPADFGFTVAEMRDAIEGTWRDAASGVELQVAVPEDAVVSYEVAAEGTGCMTMVSMPVIADVAGTTSPVRLTGSFLTTTLSGGELILQATPSGGCDLMYAELTATEAASLSGTCNDVAGLGSLSLRKTP